MTNISNLASYSLDGKLYVRVTMTTIEQKNKPTSDEIKKQHWNVETRTLTLDEMMGEISKGKAWLPATFSNGENGKPRLRLANFDKSCILVMDIDEGSYTMKEVCSFLKSQGLEPNFGYYTFSHNGKDKIRFRLGWVVGTIEKNSTHKILSKLLYTIIEKWVKQVRLNKEKVVRRPKGAILCMSLEETHDDKSSYNPVQLWQGTSKSQKTFVFHNNFLDIKNLVDTMYTFSSKGHKDRITKELREIGVSKIGYMSKGDVISKNMDCVDILHQSVINNVKDMGKTILCDDNGWDVSIWNYKEDVESMRINSQEFDGESFGTGDKSILYSRCKLLREMSETKKPIPGVDTNGHFLKRFITINLKFLADGRDILEETVVPHSDKPSSYWDNEFNKISTDTPPVKCCNFCPYASSCQYGQKTIVTAAQKSSFKDKKVIENIKVESISLEEAQNKTREYVDSLFNQHDEILNGWEYGTRRKFHHPGKAEIRKMQDDLQIKENEVSEMIIELLGKPFEDMNIYDKEFRNIIYKKAIRRPNCREMMNKWDETISLKSKIDKYLNGISEKAQNIGKNFNVLSVPVGVGKTRSIIDKLIDMSVNSKSSLNEDLHVCYAAPRHDLSDQFYDDLINGLKDKGMTHGEIEKLKIVRVYPRPKMLTTNEELEIQSLEEMGISTLRKIKSSMFKTQEMISKCSKFLSEEDKFRYLDFIIECEKYLDSRSKAQKANILICTHKYIQCVNIKNFINIDMIIIDEDMSKTMSSTVRYNMEVLDKMEELLKNRTYTFNGKTDCGFADLINIIETIKNSEPNKFYTFDSSEEICSEVGDNKVKLGMVDAKYKELALMRAQDRVNYLNLCQIKSYTINGNSVYLSFFDSLDVGDKSIIMMSANPSPEFILKKMTNKENINLMEVGYVDQKGTIIQTPFISASKQTLKNPEYVDGIKEIIKKYNPETEEVITFKSCENLFNEYGTTLHLGNTSGMNSISGKNIAVIGTYHINPQAINLFVAMFKENYSINEIELPKKRSIIYKGIEQSTTTYGYGNMRDYHIWYMYDEMIQAMGRARACRQDVKVLLISSLIYPQAEIKMDKINTEFKNSEYIPEIDLSFNSKDEIILKNLRKNSNIRYGVEKKEEKKTIIPIINDYFDDDLPF